MSVATTYSALCSVVAGSSGIRTCRTSLPVNVNTAELPLAIVRPGPAQWNEHALNQLNREERTYTISVYVMPLAQGQGLDEGYQACLAPLNALGQTLIDNPSLDNAVDQIVMPFEDGGVQALAFGGTDYHGFVMSLNIVEKTT